MNKREEKSRAIEAVIELMMKCTEFVQSIGDQPFTPEIQEKLQTLADQIQSIQQGLESGYYDN